IDGPGRLPQPLHPLHSIKKGGCESRVPKQMIIQKVEMPPRQSVDLGQRLVDLLSVEAFASFEERDLVAEVASMRATARHDYRVWYQVQMTLDEVATNLWHVD